MVVQAALCVQRHRLVHEAGDERGRGRKTQSAKRPVERRPVGGRLDRRGEGRVHELQRTSGGPSLGGRIREVDQRTDVAHAPQRTVVHVAEAEVDAEPRARRRPRGEVRDAAGQEPGDPGLCGGWHARDQHQLGRDLDLEHHVIAGLRVDRPDLADRGVGERAAVAQRTGRAEREHRHVEVAWDADLVGEVGPPALLAQTPQVRVAALERDDVSKVQRVAPQRVPTAHPERGEVLVARPAAVPLELQVGVPSERLDDGDDPVAPLAGLAVGHRAQVRTKPRHRLCDRLLGGVDRDAADEVRERHARLR